MPRREPLRLPLPSRWEDAIGVLKGEGWSHDAALNAVLRDRVGPDLVQPVTWGPKGEGRCPWCGWRIARAPRWIDPKTGRVARSHAVLVAGYRRREPFSDGVLRGTPSTRGPARRGVVVANRDAPIRPFTGKVSYPGTLVPAGGLVVECQRCAAIVSVEAPEPGLVRR
jgi:hypothetical protein